MTGPAACLTSRSAVRVVHVLALCGPVIGCGSDAPTAPVVPPPTPITTPSPPDRGPPPVPTELRVSVTGDGFTWTWDRVDDADGYRVQFSPDEVFTEDDPRVLIPSNDPSRLTFSVTWSPWSGHRPYLRVQSYIVIDREELASAWSLAVAPERPTPIFDRSTRDQPDDFPGPQVHIVYAIASDGEDHHLDIAGQIHYAVEAAQDFLAAEIQREFRIDTYNGTPDITFVRISGFSERDLAITQDQIPGLQAGIRQGMRGLRTNKLYAVFYSSDVSMGLNGRAGANIAGTYVKPSFVSNWDLFGYWEPAATMIHEVFHLLGAVPNCAPNLDRDGAHVNSAESGWLDIMSPGGAAVAGNMDEIEIDFGRDDYYGHGRPDCLDMAASPYFRTVE